jgi:hypothetical protein
MGAWQPPLLLICLETYWTTPPAKASECVIVYHKSLQKNFLSLRNSRPPPTPTSLSASALQLDRARNVQVGCHRLPALNRAPGLSAVWHESRQVLQKKKKKKNFFSEKELFRTGYQSTKNFVYGLLMAHFISPLRLSSPMLSVLVSPLLPLGWCLNPIRHNNLVGPPRGERWSRPRLSSISATPAEMGLQGSRYPCWPLSSMRRMNMEVSACDGRNAG